MAYIRAMLVCMSALFALNSVSAKDWRGLIPLVSTRVDVERLLGSPAEPCRLNVCYYETKNEHLSVKYSTGRCVDDEAGAYNVPPDTVLSIDVVPKKEPLLPDLGLDISKYDKYEDREIFGLVHYKSAEEGLYLEVYSGKVQGMTYFSMKKDDYLRCSPPKQPAKAEPGSKVGSRQQSSSKRHRRCHD